MIRILSNIKCYFKTIPIFLMMFLAFSFSGCDEVSLKDLHLTGLPDYVSVGDVIEIEAVFDPYNADDKTITWSTPTKNLITIEIIDDYTVMITAKSAGLAMLVATAKDGNLVRTLSFTIHSGALNLSIGINGKVTRMYNNSPQEVVANGVPSDVEMEYKYRQHASSEEYSLLAPTNVGIYDVYARVVSQDHAGECMGILEIVPQELIFCADDKTKKYGQTDPMLTKTLIKGKNYDELEIRGELVRELGENVGQYKIKQDDLNPFEIVGEQADNYKVTFQEGIFTITKKNLNITIDSKSSQYGLPKQELTYSVNAIDFAFDDSKEVLNGELYFENEPINVGIYLILCSITANNYNIIANNAYYTIEKAQISVTAQNCEKIYGNETPEFNYTIYNPTNTENTTKLFYQDSLSGSLKVQNDVSVGTKNILIGTLHNENYLISYTGATLVIHPREVEIEITTELNKVYGQADPTEFEYVVSSALDIIDGDILSGDYGREVGENVGNYALNLGSLSLGDNYNLSLKEGNFEIYPLEIVVIISQTTAVYGSDLEIEYSLSEQAPFDETIIVEFMDAVNYKNVGLYENVDYISISASNKQEIDTTANYVFSSQKGSIEITKAPITVTAQDKQKTYGEATPELTYIILNENNESDTGALFYDDVLFGALTTSNNENVGTYEIVQGSLNNANYEITFVSGTLTINKRAIEIEIVSGISKYYGENDPSEFDYIVVSELDVIDGDNLSGTYGREVGENVGNYKLNIGSLTLGGNYDLTIKDGNFTINKRIINILIDNASKFVGESDPDFSWQYAQDSLQIINDEILLTLSREVGEQEGDYVISATYNENNNYDIHIIDGIFTIIQNE